MKEKFKKPLIGFSFVYLFVLLFGFSFVRLIEPNTYQISIATSSMVLSKITLVLISAVWVVLVTGIVTIYKPAKNFWIGWSLLTLSWLFLLVNLFFPQEGLGLSSLNFVSLIGLIFLQFGWMVNLTIDLNLKMEGERLRKLLTGLLITTFFLTLIGNFVTNLDAGAACTAFPICAEQLLRNGLALLAMSHRLLVGIVFFVLIWVVNHTWKFYRHDTLLLTSISALFVLFIGQIFLGAYQVFQLFPFELVLLHSLSSLGFITLVGLAWWISFTTAAQNTAIKNTIFNDPIRRKDFLKLNKPIIVVLLLVTTYAGMVVGGKEIPSFWLTFWVLLAGGLAAGGASAINQYIDREIDLSMQRTANRPVPSGRLQPAEALALGVSELIFSFFLYVIFVNVLSAVLALAGMFYYVVIYSLWLKHATVQNIVIGGGAGAIPPLVGWAAATGSLNIPSLFLFAIVFLWTPPHFWALALVRRKDYARASVPMLPVIKGVRKTKEQIMIYTVELVILTLLMPLFDIGGSVYLISAAVLGVWILWAAWQVLTKEGNKVAHNMYRYSSMYLAFIFLALVIDVFV